MKYLKVRNWDRWQSYRRDRGQPPWIKVHRRLMRNPEWVALSDSERGQLVAIWLLAADHDGDIPASPELVEKLCFMDTAPNINKFIDLGFICQNDANMTPERRQDVTPKAKAEAKAEAEKTSQPSAAPPSKKSKKTQKTFDLKYDENIADSITSLCNNIKQIPSNNKKPFNPAEWVQQKANQNGHPMAIIDSLKGAIPYLPDRADWWAYIEKIFLTKNGNYNERDTVERSAAAKTELAELVKSEKFKNLISGIG